MFNGLMEMLAPIHKSNRCEQLYQIACVLSFLPKHRQYDIGVRMDLLDEQDQFMPVEDITHLILKHVFINHRYINFWANCGRK